MVSLPTPANIGVPGAAWAAARGANLGELDRKHPIALVCAACDRGDADQGLLGLPKLWVFLWGRCFSSSRGLFEALCVDLGRSFGGKWYGEAIAATRLGGGAGSRSCVTAAHRGRSRILVVSCVHRSESARHSHRHLTTNRSLCEKEEHARCTLHGAWGTA